MQKDIKSNTLPSIDEQVKFAHLQALEAAEDFKPMMRAIYESLLANRMFKAAIAAKLPDEVIQHIGMPYTIDQCREFVSELKNSIGRPANEAQTCLLRMYTALEENLYVAQWAGRTLAGRLDKESLGEEEVHHG